MHKRNEPDLSKKFDRDRLWIIELPKRQEFTKLLKNLQTLILIKIYKKKKENTLIIYDGGNQSSSFIILQL